MTAHDRAPRAPCGCAGDHARRQRPEQEPADGASAADDHSTPRPERQPLEGIPEVERHGVSIRDRCTSPVRGPARARRGPSARPPTSVSAPTASAPPATAPPRTSAARRPSPSWRTWKLSRPQISAAASAQLASASSMSRPLSRFSTPAAASTATASAQARRRRRASRGREREREPGREGKGMRGHRHLRRHEPEQQQHRECKPRGQRRADVDQPDHGGGSPRDRGHPSARPWNAGAWAADVLRAARRGCLEAGEQVAPVLPEQPYADREEPEGRRGGQGKPAIRITAAVAISPIPA